MEAEIRDEKCSICLDNFRDATQTFVCCHIFCQPCIVNWNFKQVKEEKKVNCPLCRKEDDETTKEIKDHLGI